MKNKEGLYYDREREMLRSKDGDIFIALIWPTAVRYKDEITQIIDNFPDVYLCETECISIRKEDLLWIMCWAYHLDWIPQNIIEDKCKYILSLMEDDFDIFFLKIISKDTNYNLNLHNGRKQSTQIRALKYRIRQTIKDKMENYIHDIIIHISDEGMQTVAMMELRDFLNKLNFNKNNVSSFDYDGDCLQIKVSKGHEKISNINTGWVVIEDDDNR